MTMQLFIDSYGTYIHVKDEMFEIKVKKENELVKHRYSAKKVKRVHTDEIKSGYSLNKPGKELLVPAINKYFDEDRVRYCNKNRTRGNIIQYDAHAFANTLIKRKLGKPTNIQKL